MSFYPLSTLQFQNKEVDNKSKHCKNCESCPTQVTWKVNRLTTAFSQLIIRLDLLLHRRSQRKELSFRSRTCNYLSRTKSLNISHSPHLLGFLVCLPSHQGNCLTLLPAGLPLLFIFLTSPFSSCWP